MFQIRSDIVCLDNSETKGMSGEVKTSAQLDIH